MVTNSCLVHTKCWVLLSASHMTRLILAAILSRYITILTLLIRKLRHKDQLVTSDLVSKRQSNSTQTIWLQHLHFNLSSYDQNPLLLYLSSKQLEPENLTIPSPANKVRVSFPEVSAKVSLYVTGLSQTWENANILIGQTNLGHTSPGNRTWHQRHHGQNVKEVSRTPPPEKMQYLTEMVSEYWVVKTTGEQTLHCKISPR